MREKIPLYQALKERNRLIAKIGDVKRKLNSYNSVIKGADRGADVNDLMEQLVKLKQQLVLMKTAIARGNAGILDKLHDLEETKDMIVFIKALDSKHGNHAERYISDQVLEYEAVITNADKDKLIDMYIAKAGKLQDEIDEYNYTTKV